MTEEEAVRKIRAEKAAYMREWRKKNPDKVKANRERSKQYKINRYMREGKDNE